MIRVDRGNPQADVLGKTCDMHMLGQDQLSQTGQGPHRGIIKSYNETKVFVSQERETIDDDGNRAKVRRTRKFISIVVFPMAAA